MERAMHVLDPGVREPGAAGLEHEAKAGDGTRTRDIQLGKLTLYQLSYTRSRRPNAGQES